MIWAEQRFSRPEGLLHQSPQEIRIPSGDLASTSYGIPTTRPFRPESTRTEFWHRHIWWWHRILSCLGFKRRRGSHSPRFHLHGSRSQSLRHRRRVFRRPLRDNSGQSRRRTPSRCPDLHQGHLPHGEGPERSGIIAPSFDSGLRSQPAAPGHRLHRYLPPPRIRRAHSRRRSSEHAQPPGRKRKGTLHCLLNFPAGI